MMLQRESLTIPFIPHPNITFDATLACGSKTHFMDLFYSKLRPVIAPILLLVVFPVSMLAQSAAGRNLGQDDGGSWFWIIVLILVVAGGGILYYLRGRSDTTSKPDESSQRTNYYYENERLDLNGLDVDKELQWLRKAKRSKSSAEKTSTFQSKSGLKGPPVRASAPGDIDTKDFQEKMRKLQYSQLPINTFSTLTDAKAFSPLPVSVDPNLLNAIEQANEEFEDDEAVREIAVRVLAAFKSSNSVDALTQIALYDLSSNLRSKAVTTLTEFDHPSVFEPILLACADPTREVRASAARGLFRLSFNRADAWKRILESQDIFRMSHAARAAIESGIATKSFERLIHDDMKVAKEAFALVAFIIGSGETAELFKAIREHKDDRVKFAILHVFKAQKDERILRELQKLNIGSLSRDVADRVKDTIASFDQVMA